MNKLLYGIILLNFSAWTEVNWQIYEEKSNNILISVQNSSDKKINLECGNLAHPMWLKISLEPGTCQYVLIDVFKDQTVDCTAYEGLLRIDGISSIKFQPANKLTISNTIMHSQIQPSLASADTVNKLLYDKTKLNLKVVKNDALLECSMGPRNNPYLGLISQVLENAKQHVQKNAPKRLLD